MIGELKTKFVEWWHTEVDDVANLDNQLDKIFVQISMSMLEGQHDSSTADVSMENDNKDLQRQFVQLLKDRFDHWIPFWLGNIGN